MENEMIALPIVWALIVGTAFLSAIVSQALPMLPYYWNAFKTYIKGLFTREKGDIVDIVILAQLQDQINALEARVEELEGTADTFAERFATQQRNRKYNLRRDVRDYLEELKNG